MSNFTRLITEFFSKTPSVAARPLASQPEPTPDITPGYFPIEKKDLKIQFIGDVESKSKFLRTFNKSNSTVPLFNQEIVHNYQITEIKAFDIPIKFSIWTTSDHAIFRMGSSKLYDRHVKSQVVFYDVANFYSFDIAKKFLAHLEEKNEKTIMLVGENSGLAGDNVRHVTKEQGRVLADEYGIKFLECSANDEIAVSLVFEEIASCLVPELSVQKGLAKCLAKIAPLELTEAGLLHSDCANIVGEYLNPNFVITRP